MAAASSNPCLSRKRQLARGHLVEQHPERPDIAAGVRGLAAEQLRSHVGRRAGERV